MVKVSSSTLELRQAVSLNVTVPAYVVDARAAMAATVEAFMVNVWEVECGFDGCVFVV
jgi:hypothetical protein